MYRIVISPRAKNELKNIAKLYRKALTESIDQLTEDNFM